jgi:copper chaperone CopZ
MAVACGHRVAVGREMTMVKASSLQDGHPARKPDRHATMTHTFIVQNIRCGGCANTITRKLGDAGIPVLAVDPATQTVVVDTDDAAVIAQGETVLKGLGYPLAGAESGITDTAKSFVSCAIGRLTPG